MERILGNRDHKINSLVFKQSICSSTVCWDKLKLCISWDVSKFSDCGGFPFWLSHIAGSGLWLQCHRQSCLLASSALCRLFLYIRFKQMALICKNE